MSVYGMMRTGASGMNAQSNRLGAVADNIANVSTVGYKAAGTEFSSLLVGNASGAYASGGVETEVRYGIAAQGALTFSASPFDLAINGGGFLVVEDSVGRSYLTRAGAFVPDSNGMLVNSAGFKLLGMPASAGSFVLNGTAGLEPVVIGSGGLQATPTTGGTLVANLPSSAAAVNAADLPSLNAANSTSTAQSSIVVYDDLGAPVVLDVHFARTTVPGEWEVSIFDAAGRAAGGSFPYASAAITTAVLQFGADGRLAPASVASLSIAIPGGQAMDLDLAGTTQLAADYTVLSVDADGNAPSGLASVEIADDGTLYEIYENGARKATFRIPLGGVVSPDQLTPVSGNVFDLSNDSGDLQIGFAQTAGFGSLVSGALEQSTVDLASELTDMIEAQRNYTANSRVFQTGSELLDVLVNLKR